jgi:predicted RNA-binding protein with PUA-like domain
MKTEPDTFSFDDLLKAPKRTTSWEGVRNYMARNLMRDQMKLGDQAFFYHSSCEVPGIVGITEVVRESHPDDSALDPKSEYFDEKSAKKGESQWAMVAVRAKARMKHFVPLSELREAKGLERMMVIQRGSRLSVQPVTAAEWQVIIKLGKPEEL